jgi:hypothetical protein
MEFIKSPVDRLAGVPRHPFPDHHRDGAPPTDAPPGVPLPRVVDALRVDALRHPHRHLRRLRLPRRWTSI